MSDDVFLGLELEVARVSEELRRATASGPSPLADVVYPAEATVVWRWVDAQEDAEVWAFVRAYSGFADSARVRSSLTMDDFYTLMTFARRCVLAALRNEDPGAVEAAFDALSAIDIERVDWRDVVMEASLASYAARRVGVPPNEVLPRALRRADPLVAEILEHAATTGIDLVRDWGYREVSTPAGPVLVETDGQPATEADDDLLRRAFALVDLVAADGTYEVTGIGLEDGVPEAWLTSDAAEARQRLRGCVLVDAEPSDVERRNNLMVFLAEAENERDAEVIAAAGHWVGDNVVQLGIAVGRRCAVIIAKSPTKGEPGQEDTESLSRFRAPISTLLAEPATH